MTGKKVRLVESGENKKSNRKTQSLLLPTMLLKLEGWMISKNVKNSTKSAKKQATKVMKEHR